MIKRKVYTIDIGDMSPQKAEIYIIELMKKFKGG